MYAVSPQTGCSPALKTGRIPRGNFSKLNNFGSVRSVKERVKQWSISSGFGASFEVSKFPKNPITGVTNVKHE